MKVTSIQSPQHRRNYNNLTPTKQSKPQVTFGYHLFALNEDKYLKKFENDYNSPTDQHTFFYRNLIYNTPLREIRNPKTCNEMPWDDVNIDINTLFYPNYNCVLSKEKMEKDNLRLQELFNADVQRVKDNLKVNPEKIPDPKFELLCKKVITASCVGALKDTDYNSEYSFSALFGKTIGHTEEKYELMRDVLSPIAISNKFAVEANTPRMFAETHINTQYSLLAMKKFMPIPKGVLLYGSADKDNIAATLFYSIPGSDSISRHVLKDLDDISPAEFKYNLYNIREIQRWDNFNKHTLIFIDSKYLNKNHPFHDLLLEFMNNPTIAKEATFITTADKPEDLAPDFVQKFDKQIEIKKLEKSEFADAIYNHLAYSSNSNGLISSFMYSENRGKTLPENTARNEALKIAEQMEKNQWDISQSELKNIVNKLQRSREGLNGQTLYNEIESRFPKPPKQSLWDWIRS